MADRIDKIIDAAIDYTNIIIANRTADWLTARQGLAKMLASLQAGAPEHPGFERLRRFIARQDLIHNPDDISH
jgi:hypothetical protein